MVGKFPPIRERLLQKIDKSGGPNSCWPWVGTRCPGGYGNIWYAGQNRTTHALVLEAHSGEFADGRSCLHSCDNPACCNPAHLRWGTPKENAEDRDKRGRYVYPAGEQHGCAKLTEAQVRVIRRRYKARDRLNGASALAREFGVSDSQIRLIIYNKRWRV